MKSLCFVLFSYIFVKISRLATVDSAYSFLAMYSGNHNQTILKKELSINIWKITVNSQTESNGFRVLLAYHTTGAGWKSL